MFWVCPVGLLPVQHAQKTSEERHMRIIRCLDHLNNHTLGFILVSEHEPCCNVDFMEHDEYDEHHRGAVNDFYKIMMMVVVVD